MGKLSCENALHGGTNSLGEIYEGMLYMETNDSFPLIDLTWVIDILFENLTPQIGDWIWKTPSAHYASGVADFMSSFWKNF